MSKFKVGDRVVMVKFKNSGGIMPLDQTPDPYQRYIKDKKILIINGISESDRDYPIKVEGQDNRFAECELELATIKEWRDIL